MLRRSAAPRRPNHLAREKECDLGDDLVLPTANRTPSTCAPRRSAPRWMQNLADQIARDYGIPRQRVVIVDAKYAGSFAGRHYPDDCVIAVLFGGNLDVAFATVIHEMAHSIRKYRGEPKGHHDRGFYKLADELYARYHVPQKIATYIEQCDGPVCATNLIKVSK